MSKKKIIIISIIIFLLIIIGMNLLKNISEKIKKDSPLSQINKILEEKKDKIVFFLDTSNLTTDTEVEIFNDLEKDYNLDVLRVDIEKPNNNYEEILKKFNIDSNYFQAPALIIIKDGELLNSIINFQNSDILSNFLLTNNVITEKELNQKKAITYKDYKDIYESKNLEVILLGINDNNYKTAKLNLEELSQEKNINYRYLILNNASGADARLKIEKELGEIVYPHIIIVGGGKIIDHTANFGKKDILKILEKNNIVKEN